MARHGHRLLQVVLLHQGVRLRVASESWTGFKYAPNRTSPGRACLEAIDHCLERLLLLRGFGQLPGVARAPLAEGLDEHHEGGDVAVRLGRARLALGVDPGAWAGGGLGERNVGVGAGREIEAVDEGLELGEGLGEAEVLLGVVGAALDDAVLS